MAIKFLPLGSGAKHLGLCFADQSQLKTSAQFMSPSRCQILYALENHIGVFMDIFIYERARRIGDQNVLRKVDAAVDALIGQL